MVSFGVLRCLCWIVQLMNHIIFNVTSYLPVFLTVTPGGGGHPEPLVPCSNLGTLCFCPPSSLGGPGRSYCFELEEVGWVNPKESVTSTYHTYLLMYRDNKLQEVLNLYFLFRAGISGCTRSYTRPCTRPSTRPSAMPCTRPCTRCLLLPTERDGAAPLLHRTGNAHLNKVHQEAEDVVHKCIFLILPA